MKDLNHWTFTTRKLAGVLTAICCVCAAAIAQAGEADVRAGVNGGATLQAQSGTAAASAAAETDADTDLWAGAAVRPPAGVTVPEAGLTGEEGVASEATAAVAEAVAASTLDALVDSAVQNEIAAAIESSVQGDIQSAIENDLVTEVTESLPLP